MTPCAAGKAGHGRAVPRRKYLSGKMQKRAGAGCAPARFLFFREGRYHGRPPSGGAQLSGLYRFSLSTNRLSRAVSWAQAGRKPQRMALRTEGMLDQAAQ